MKVAFLLLTGVLVLGGCATKYKTWQGGGVQVGQGGACETVAGVEVWSHGRPNRPYRVVGLIEDSRPGGVIPMAMREEAVARAARDKGADGLIVMDESKEYMGTYHSMNAWSTGTADTQIMANTSFQGNTAYTRGTVHSVGNVNTFGSGLSVPLMKAHGTYQVFRYVTGAEAGKVKETGVRQGEDGTLYLR